MWEVKEETNSTLLTREGVKKQIKTDENLGLIMKEVQKLSDRLDILEEVDKIDSDEFKEINKRIDKLEKCNRIAEVKEHIEGRLEESTKDLNKIRLKICDQ